MLLHQTVPTGGAFRRTDARSIPYTKRLEQEKPVLDALLAWANETISKTAPKSPLGKALHYLLEQWPYLVRYLEDGRLELSNNRAERSIKPFVMGRKNWLFANTPAGAQSSALIYSLIETTKENKLDPYRYLLWVLRYAPNLSQVDKGWAENFLPAKAPQQCRIPQIWLISTSVHSRQGGDFYVPFLLTITQELSRPKSRKISKKILPRK